MLSYYLAMLSPMMLSQAMLSPAMLSPYTSDNSQLNWLIPVCIVSAVLIVVLIVFGKKRK